MCGGVIVCFTCGPLLSLNARLHQTIPSIHPVHRTLLPTQGAKNTRISGGQDSGTG